MTDKLLKCPECGSDLVELANLIAHSEQVAKWQATGEHLVKSNITFSVTFALGAWWADRPWRTRKGGCK